MSIIYIFSEEKFPSNIRISVMDDIDKGKAIIVSRSNRICQHLQGNELHATYFLCCMHHIFLLKMSKLNRAKIVESVIKNFGALVKRSSYFSQKTRRRDNISSEKVFIQVSWYINVTDTTLVHWFSLTHSKSLFEFWRCFSVSKISKHLLQTCGCLISVKNHLGFLYLQL